MLSPASGPAVLHQGNDVVSLYVQTVLSLWKSSLDGLASSQVLRLTLSGAPKIILYCTEYRQPTTLCHGWGWQPPQTASHIHIRHIQSDLAHWYAVHRHNVAALHSYTHPTWLRFWGSGSLVEAKWCDYVMFEADSHLKLLLHTSILDI